MSLSQIILAVWLVVTNDLLKDRRTNEVINDVTNHNLGYIFSKKLFPTCKKDHYLN